MHINVGEPYKSVIPTVDDKDMKAFIIIIISAKKHIINNLNKVQKPYILHSINYHN